MISSPVEVLLVLELPQVLVLSQPMQENRSQQMSKPEFYLQTHLHFQIKMYLVG